MAILDSTATAPLPRRFGNYTLLQSLGRGGMGEVFLARMTASRGLEGAERLCVIKTVRADLLAEDEYVKRFIDEARLAVTLAHAGVCHVFDAGRADGVLYLAMEHIAGVTVKDVIDACTIKGETIPLGHGIWILLELLDALDYAHGHIHPETGLPLNVVHRDVSPQNVMVTFDGEVKLIDFGLASSLMKALQTGDDHVMGKVAYMAPEQVQGAKLDGRADQYAAAILAVELLCGERFYGDLDNTRVTQHVAAGGFRPPPMKALPAGVQRVLDRALAPSRESRFPSCGAMAAALRAELAKLAPTMARVELRAWTRSLLEKEVLAHRALLRGLPATSPPAEAPLAPIEPTTREPKAKAPSESSSQNVRILEAPKTETMVRPPRGAESSEDSRTDEDKRPTSDDLAPKTDEDLKAPALELDRPDPATFVLSAPRRAPRRSTAPQGTVSSSPAPPSRAPLLAMVAMIAVVAVVIIAVWLR